MIRECIRGVRPWNDLEAIGIGIESDGDRLVVENPRGHLAVATPEDVAEGFTRLAEDTDRLSEWASILLGASSFIDLRLENQVYGEALLEGLWEASAGEPIRESAALAAKELYLRR